MIDPIDEKSHCVLIKTLPITWTSRVVYLILAVLLIVIMLPFPALADDLLDLKRKTDQLADRLDMLESSVGNLSGETGDHKPRIQLNGFSDFGYKLENTRSDINSNTFALGSIVLFINSQLTDRVSFLLETDFASNPTSNSASFRLQRSLLRYAYSDRLNITIGRFHTALGYWNQTYSHGRWLQPTISRPEIYHFESGGGGFLPVHGVGIEFFGLIELEPLDLDYSISVLNGRGRTRTEVQQGSDKNDQKALNVLLTLRPDILPGLRFGGDLYFDTIPADPGVPGRDGRIREEIIGGFARYELSVINLLGEIFLITHDDTVSDKEFEALGYYLQAVFRVGPFSPYYRFDSLNFEPGDPYYAGTDVDQRISTGGIRWDFLPWNALMFELRFNDRTGAKNIRTGHLNWSFAF